MGDTEKFQPWELNWTSEHVNRFWDWWGSNPALGVHYFSKIFGDSIISQISRYIRLTGVVIDLGAGPGHLVDLLIKRGAVKVLALDASPRSVYFLKQKFEGHPNFLDARVNTMESIPVNDSEGDIVILIETVEHLGDGILESVLREARRITKKDGYIVITTPNEEELSHQKIMCPSCGCVFHFYQHIRSWSVETLSEKMASVGYSKIICKQTLFSSLPKSLRLFHGLAYQIMGRKLPSILYIGRAKR